MTNNMPERVWISPDNVVMRTILDYVQKCEVCSGTGEYQQRYTAGCGMGYYNAMGPCEYCDETGWVYRESGEPVPKSVLNQISVALEAAK